MPKSGADDPNMSKSAQSVSVTTSVYSNGVSTTSTATLSASAADTKKKDSKKKPKSSDNKAGGGGGRKSKSKSKSKPKSREKAVSSGSATKQSKSKEKKKTKSKKTTKSKEKKKKKSADGGKSKEKKSSERKSKKKKSAESKKKSGKKGSKSSGSGNSSRPVSLTAHEKKKICHKVRKIEASKGAVGVNSEKAIEGAGYLVKDVAPYYTSDYSTVLSAESKKDGAAVSQLVVKVITLAECSPRARVNLLQNSVRIMRFVGGGGSGGNPKKVGASLSPFFPSVADIYLVGTVKLFVFMQYIPGRSVYDWVKVQRKQGGELNRDEAVQTMIRKWFKAMVKGVHELQRIGVAHRAVKLQHILLDESNKPKLIGWSKSVFFYEPSKRTVLLQKKERRLRSNLHLPPEAFTAAYDPALADRWSLGVALVAMSTCSYPFNVRDKKTKFSAQWRRFIKSHMMSSFVRNLCHRIFVIDPKGRVSTKALLKDKYFEVPAKKLTEVSCKLGKSALLAVKEDSRLGGMSAIENVQEVKAATPVAAPVAAASVAAPVAEASPALPEEVGAEGAAEVADFTGAEAAAAEGGEDEAAAVAAAGGYDGGAVGEEEENLPPEEAQEEAHLSQMNAPEEAEAEALPEEGEEGVEEAAPGEEGDEEGGGGGEGAEDGAEE